jgi:CheY-like chemotaxis protein
MDRVAIVDDDDGQAQSVAELLRDGGLVPILLTDLRRPVGSVEDLIAAVRGRAESAVCDHRLSPRGLANFSGAQAVARLYEEQVPAILITQYAEMDNDVSIRRWRDRVPIVLERDEATDPTVFRKSLLLCSDELSGHFTPTRRARRSIVRLEARREEDGTEVFDVFISQWRAYTAVRMPIDCIPEALRPPVDARLPFRLTAEVNIEAEHARDLFFRKFEPYVSTETS